MADGNQSDSDLSDAQPARVGAAFSESPESPDALGSPDSGPEFAPDEQGEQSESSDHDAMDDGDFDGPASPRSVQSNDDASDRATSPSGRAAAKRKATQVIEDDYMRENPELYGLRRSV